MPTSSFSLFDAIFSVLRKYPNGATLEILRKEVGGTPASVHVIAWRMVRAGVIHVWGKGRVKHYTLPPIAYHPRD
jgi:hypothetical protein